eukprot:gene1368-32732_t
MGHSTRLQDYLKAYIAGFDQFRWQEWIMGVTLMIILICIREGQRFYRPLRHIRSLGPIFLCVIGICSVYLGKINEPERGSVKIVGHIQSGLPSFTVGWWFPMSDPSFSDLILTGIVVMIVNLLESTSIARALARKIIGLGLANLAGAAFNAYTTTGSFSRSAVNDSAGAKTPLSQTVCGLVVMIVLLFLTSVFAKLPFNVMAAIVIVSVSGLFEFEQAIYLWKVNKMDLVCWLASCFGCLFISIDIGLAIAVGLAIAIALYQSAFPHTAVLGRLHGNSSVYSRWPAVLGRLHRDSSVSRSGPVDGPQTLAGSTETRLCPGLVQMARRPWQAPQRLVCVQVWSSRWPADLGRLHRDSSVSMSGPVDGPLSLAGSTETRLCPGLVQMARMTLAGSTETRLCPCLVQMAAVLGRLHRDSSVSRSGPVDGPQTLAGSTENSSVSRSGPVDGPQTLAGSTETRLCPCLVQMARCPWQAPQNSSVSMSGPVDGPLSLAGSTETRSVSMSGPVDGPQTLAGSTETRLCPGLVQMPADLGRLHRDSSVSRSGPVDGPQTLAGSTETRLCPGLVQMARRPWQAPQRLVCVQDWSRSIKQYPDACMVPGILAFRIDAPVYFANAKTLEDKIEKGVSKLHYLIIDLTPVHHVDSMGLHFLEDMIFTTKRRDIQLILANPSRNVALDWKKVRVPDLVGRENIFVSMHDAFMHAQNQLVEAGINVSSTTMEVNPLSDASLTGCQSRPNRHETLTDTLSGDTISNEIAGVGLTLASAPDLNRLSRQSRLSHGGAL